METSHYSESDWEKYRERNIAMIFQDFNIIENLTVLENVELALLRMDDVKERRRIAKELIGRVGLTKQMNSAAASYRAEKSSGRSSPARSQRTRPLSSQTNRRATSMSRHQRKWRHF